MHGAEKKEILGFRSYCTCLTEIDSEISRPFCFALIEKARKERDAWVQELLYLFSRKRQRNFMSSVFH